VLDFKREPGLWVLFVFWTVFFLFLDVKLIGKGLVLGLRSDSFPTAPGTVTKNKLIPNNKGSVRLELEYTYAVNGVPYIGTNYHIPPQLVGDGFWIEAHDAHPAGLAAPVYYDPHDPSTAFLRPGLRPDSLFILWLLTPFHLITIAMAWAAWWALANRREFDPALRRCAWERSDGWTARAKIATSPLAFAFLTLLAVTFAGSFVCAGFTSLSNSPPQWWMPAGMWSAAFAVSVLIAVIGSRQLLVRVNDEGIEFPVSCQRTRVERERVSGVTIATETRKSEKSSREVSVVSLHWRTDVEQSARIAVYNEPADAARLADWLRERLGLSVDRSQPK
jgi:hypothetical protein